MRMFTTQHSLLCDASRPAEPTLPAQPSAGGIPREAELILSAMEAASQPHANRRTIQRITWRVQAGLRLFIDQATQSPRIIFTRDVHARSLGFITRQRLPLGYGGVVDLPGRGGLILSVACTLLRCRQPLDGWYEGVVYFNRELVGLDRLIV